MPVALIVAQQKWAGRAQVRQTVSEDPAASGKTAIFRVLDAISLPLMGAQPRRRAAFGGVPPSRGGPQSAAAAPSGTAPALEDAAAAERRADAAMEALIAEVRRASFALSLNDDHVPLHMSSTSCWCMR